MLDKTVNIIIGLVSFIVIIIFCIKIGLDYKKLNDLKKNTMFPPWPAQCPDYWTSVSTTVGGKTVIKSKNTHKIGICRTGDDDQGNVVEFDGIIWKGGKGRTRKCAWAKACKAPWEGIDNIC